MRIGFIIGLVLISGTCFANGKKKAAKAEPKEKVTVIDMSGPSEPEAEFPVVTQKGKL